MALRSRSLVILIGSVLLLAAAGYGWIHRAGRLASTGPVITPGAGSSSIDQTSAGEALRLQVAAFCGDCHAAPHPDTFPQAAWEAEVDRGYGFYFDSDRDDLVLPAKADIVRYYRDLAPEKLVLSAQPPDPSANSRLFVRDVTAIEIAAPAVSHLDWSGADGDFIACDMRSGAVERYRLRAQFTVDRLATLQNPARVVRCDLDGDGCMDLIVADLGSFQARDHDLGRVIWLRGSAEDGFEEIVLLDGIGRVADVEPADFDGDGDEDLVVAEFGWIKTGAIRMLENLGTGTGRDRFSPRILDRRHGTIHVPVLDLNQDGRPDLVALLSQEHEAVEAFMNSGDGTFRRRELLFSGGDPAFGSSGIQPVDLDQDGDLDLLLTNGDTFDSFILKPYHSLRWLENTGRESFTEHRLLSMPGVHRAVAADFDGDGDLDVAAVSLIPHDLLQTESGQRLDSVVWLEQTTRGQFVRHVIEESACNHVTLVAGDFDDDGDIDLVTGTYDTSPGRELPALILWRNNRLQSAGQAARQF